MTVEEIRKFAPTIGPLAQLSMTGGETFIRKEFPEIAGILIDATDARWVTIPTNASLTNKMVNFSAQLPNDETSLLPIHSDSFSGESPFQINLWVPLTNAYDSNAMFIFNPKFSSKVMRNIRDYEQEGISKLVEEHPDECTFLKVSSGEALIFSPTCLHGNIINKTKETRLSFNCRYKNLFSPYTENEGSEKKLGSFYSPLTPKAASLIGLNFNFDDSE